MWAYLLEQTDGNPYQAQLIWENLSAEWYGYWQCWLDERARKDKQG